MMAVFAAGVLSGLGEDRYSFVCPGAFERGKLKSTPDSRRMPGLKKENSSKISGTTSTLNGIPIALWLEKSGASARKVISDYCRSFTDQGCLTGKEGTKDAFFAHGLDFEKKFFYGAMAYGNGNGSQIIPFSIPLGNGHFKDTWDRDFPRELQRPDGFHFRTNDGGVSFESLFFLEKHPQSWTLSILETAFQNAGWNPGECLLKNKDHIKLYSKDKKSCIVNVHANQNNPGKEALVCIQMGSM